MIELGHVREVMRYPVKSMAGIAVGAASLGWHGFAGDRRLAFRRVGDESGFPWLTASRLAELLLYQPEGMDESTGEPLPTHVRTPSGSLLELRSSELQREIAERFGHPVELMQLRNGIFDDAPVSVIDGATIAAIGREAGVGPDHRRFRPNIVLETGSGAFGEDGWVGGTLLFGDRKRGAAVSVTARDVRCVMISLDPETAAQEPRVLKAAVRLNRNNAGVYGTVVRSGTVTVGDPVSFVPDAGR